jgi:HD superfamily phosphohydrolase
MNDPVHGFIHVQSPLIFQLIRHPFVQRLRRIRQLGLSELVYPGATHTRFHHAIGAMHLMGKSLDILRSKDIAISKEEYEAACAAILLHDIGHGPFSHTLERSIINGMAHERISHLLMERLDAELNGQLQMARQMFEGSYPRKFFTQLISGQLDMDRLDYLLRDSFYTGVSEGIVGADRIVHMLHVQDDELVVEEKAIYSIEKFIIARRLMYWQVYLHKTVIAADILLWKILLRARQLVQRGQSPDIPEPLAYFFTEAAASAPDSWETLSKFVQLDDHDVLFAVKRWQFSDDQVLSVLCRNLLERKLPQIEISNMAIPKERVEAKLQSTADAMNISLEDASFFVHQGELENDAYRSEGGGIRMLMKNGTLEDVTRISDNYSLEPLKTTVVKHYLSFPRAV